MMPMPPAADTAPTSSGLEHGYIAPQISGTSMPACSVRGVRTTGMPPIVEAESGFPQKPLECAPRHHLVGQVADLDVHRETLGVVHGRRNAARFGRERAACFLDVFHREARQDAADAG